MRAIEVKELCYRYRPGAEVLQGVSFSVAQGERVAFVGPNGAGKSTLLLHLNGLLPGRSVNPPAVWVFDTPVVEPHLAKIRSIVGLLFQDPDDQLFCSTVWEDVSFGPQQMKLEAKEVEVRTEQSLKQVGLEDFGYRNPVELSRGEKRRACLAGLLACDSKILVLDEPTTDLDPRGRRELKALLKRLPQTQIIATHDLDLVVELCSRVIVLDDGRLVAQGSPAAVLAQEELMLAHGLECPHILKY